MPKQTSDSELSTVEALHLSERLWHRWLMMFLAAFAATIISALIGGYAGYSEIVWIALPIAIFFFVAGSIAQYSHHHAFIELRRAQGIDRKSASKEYAEKYPSD